MPCCTRSSSAGTTTADSGRCSGCRYAIDKFQLRADLSRRRWPRAVVFVFDIYTQFIVRFTLSREIQSMNGRLEEIIDNSSKYGTVYNGPRSSEKDKSWKQSTSIRREWLWENSPPFEMIVRLNEKEELKKKLTNQSGRVVIYIVGDSGMGKRTLLRSAYEDEDIRNHFDVRFSVSFQPSISEANIVQEIKKKLKTYDSLHRKSDADSIRFLVWIKSPVSIKLGYVELELLRMVGQEIKIMVSATSSHEWLGNSPFVELLPLNKQESLVLFGYTVDIWMRGTSDYIKTEMEKVRENIIDYTNGRPLAAVCLAKFMIAMDNYHKWEIAPDTMSNINDDKLKVIILLCIDDLPDELKLCLLYTAGFPENTTIDAKQLLRLWTAEGFLSPQHGMEVEQLGQFYLKELIHRGLLINMTSSTKHGDYVHLVSVHEVLRQIFRSEGQRRSFMHVNCSDIVAAPDNTRRLALQNYYNATLRLGDCCSKLRTVVSFSPSLKKRDEKDYGEDTTKSRGTDSGPNREGCWASCQLTCSRATCSASMTTGSTSSCCGITWNPGTSRTDLSRNDEPSLYGGMRPLLKGSPYLRVIHLEDLDIGTDVPDEIGDMVYLRYLGIKCPSLKRVPESIGKLGRLQTLDVRSTQVTELPSSFWKIKTLIHVLGDELRFPKMTKEKMPVILFPKKKEEKSADLDSLHTLETVTIQHMDRWKQRLRLLHRLHVVKLQESHRGDLEILLKALSSLQSLSLSAFEEDAIPIDWFISCNSPDAGSTYWANHVMSLELDGMLRLPGKPIQETTDLSGYNICLLTLTHLVLKSTQIGQSFIDVIAKLPVLAELELLMGSYEGTTVVFCAQGFRSLKELRLSGLFRLKTIMGPDRKMERIATLMDMGRVEYETHNYCRFCKSSQSDDKKNPTSGDNRTNATQTKDGTSNLNPTSGQQQQNSEQEAGNLGTAQNLLRERIMEAIDNGNSSKTAIETYIRRRYRDPLVLLLEHMEERNELETTIQRNHKIYFAEPREGAKRPATVLEMIRAVMDKNGSTKTAISINFKKKYGDNPLTKVLQLMVNSGVLVIKKVDNYLQYSRPKPPGGNSDNVKPGKQDHGAAPGGTGATDKA